MNTARITRRQIMPTCWLAEYIEPLIQKRIKANEFENGVEGRENQTGAIDEISLYASFILKVQLDTARRRLYSIRNRECKTVNLTIADAMLESLDSSIHMCDVPVLAGSIDGAKEMVDAYHFARDEFINTFEERRLARQLLNFCLGVIAGLEADMGDTAAMLEELENSHVKSDLVRNMEKAA